MGKVIRQILFILAVIGTLYHVYLVIHPYLPFWHFRQATLDLTQVQRAAHVFLVSLLGYLN